MSNFQTKVDFSTQIKEYANTEGTLSGSVNVQQYTILGTDYANLPLGLDPLTTGISATYVYTTMGYFTGTTGSTTYYFTDSNMDIANPYLATLNGINSGLTQNVAAFSPTYSTTIDGNYFDIIYSGVSFDMTPASFEEYIAGEFSGVTFTNVLNYLSGTTYPWWFLKSGSTTWNEVKGRLQTDRITITESASTGYILTCLDSSGNASWQPSPTSIFTGGTGTCITNLYVSNIHSCSPLNINPLDEGNVYFGSTSGLTYDVTNKRLGLGINSPSYLLHISGKTSNTEVYYDDINPSPSFLLKTNNNNNLSQIGLYDGSSTSSVILTFRGLNDLSYSAFGKPGDATLYASVNTNGLNIMNNNGTNKEDYIRFYAGTNASTDSPDMHIQGSGATTGYIGMGTKTPTTKLHIYTTNGYDQFKMETSFTPTGSGDTNGSIGSIVWDDNFIYIKTTAGWKRTGLSTF